MKKLTGLAADVKGGKLRDNRQRGHHGYKESDTFELEKKGIKSAVATGTLILHIQNTACLL